jgi:adenine phosphoribosyltransferase
MTEIIDAIRNIPDFPKQGILFRDITPALLNPNVFSQICDTFFERYRGSGIDKVAAMESRGFIFGSVLAYQINAGFIPIRKKGKLPWRKVSESYSLEYGEEALEMHTDAVRKGDRIIIIDDLLATGGTAEASCKMVEKLGGIVNELCFLIELADLKGRARLNGRPVFSLITF